MTEIIGFVAKLATKSGTGKRGPWTAYSARIQTKDGQELPKWFQFGFDAPPCKEGDYVKFQATDKDANAMTVTPGTVVVAKNPPPRPQAEQSGQSGGGQRRGGGARDAYWEEKDRYDKEEREPRIRFQAARKDAIELVPVLISVDALPIPKAKGKANEVKRFDEILDIVNKITVQFYHDTESLRLLETVADAGDVNVRGDGDLPDSEEFGDDDEDQTEPSDDEWDDDIPF